MPTIQKQNARTDGQKKRGASAVDRIGDLPLDRSVRINLYGRSGTGKTTLWATFPKPILVLVRSGGSRPGELRSLDPRTIGKTIFPVGIEKSSEIRELVEHVKDEGKYATVVLDHATGLQDLILAEILGLAELPAQSSWGMARQQDYGTCGLQMKENLRMLLNLDCNVVVVAQEREFSASEESEIVVPYVASALMPSVVGWLNPACDYICETFIRGRTEERETKIGDKVMKTRVKAAGVDYCLRTAPDPVYTTKFRVPKGRPLPDVLVDPDYGKIVSLIEGKL